MDAAFVRNKIARFVKAFDNYFTFAYKIFHNKFAGAPVY